MRKNNKVIVLICVLIFALILTSLSLHISKPIESQLFRKYVLSPIPKSVMNIKVDQQKYYSGHTYVFYFKIGKADVDSLLKSRAFIEFDSVRYEVGNLFWGSIKNAQTNIQENLYNNNQLFNTPLAWDNKPPPDWFKLNTWNKPKIYRYRDKYRKANTYITMVLIFNEEVGQAYFIEQLARF